MRIWECFFLAPDFEAVVYASLEAWRGNSLNVACQPLPIRLSAFVVVRSVLLDLPLSHDRGRHERLKPSYRKLVCSRRLLVSSQGF